jgi:hypothetical protein
MHIGDTTWILCVLLPLCVSCRENLTPKEKLSRLVGRWVCTTGYVSEIVIDNGRQTESRRPLQTSEEVAISLASGGQGRLTLQDETVWGSQRCPALFEFNATGRPILHATTCGDPQLDDYYSFSWKDGTLELDEKGVLHLAAHAEYRTAIDERDYARRTAVSGAFVRLPR